MSWKAGCPYANTRLQPFKLEAARRVNGDQAVSVIATILSVPVQALVMDEGVAGHRYAWKTIKRGSNVCPTL